MSDSLWSSFLWARSGISSSAFEGKLNDKAKHPASSVCTWESKIHPMLKRPHFLPNSKIKILNSYCAIRPTNTADIKGSPKPFAYHENLLIPCRHGPCI